MNVSFDPYADLINGEQERHDDIWLSALTADDRKGLR